ncbi:MAG: hypothetical protein JW884_00090 [Deltaproteobacteria bacterium]|nr:hypothetical protein [Deltaproteobacteria bacterium]
MKHEKTSVSAYIWLIAAVVILFFAGGDRPLEIAVWLSPFLLLRFFREVKPWIALLFALPCVSAVTLLADRGMSPLPLSIFISVTVINSAIALIPYFLDGLLSRASPSAVRTLLFPSAAVAAEAFLASQFSGGTWGNPAYGINNLTLLQLVSVTGIWGLLFLIYWTASVGNEIWEHRHHLGFIRKMVTTYFIVIMVIYGFGQWRLYHEKPAAQMVRVSGITPGAEHRAEMMSIFGKIFSSKRTGVFDSESIRIPIQNSYRKLLAESVKMADSGVEMVVWPEGATFLFESDEEAFIQKAAQSAQEHNFYLGLGIIILQDSCQKLVAENQPFAQNKLILIAPDGRIAWEYSKSNLAPGYEYAMTIRGDGVLKALQTANWKVTGAICYDMDFPSYIRQAGKMKADLLLAPSNDWPEIKHTHAKMARLRAIENGASLLRPASSGLSIAADPCGNIVSYVDDLRSDGAPLVAVLPVGSVRTLYTLIGDCWKWVCVFGVVFLIVLSIVRRGKKT